MGLLDTQASEIVRLLHEKLRERQDDIQRFDNYYRGEHPLAFATPEFQAAFGGLFRDFSDNWCGVVVDSTAERLEVRGFRADGAREDDRASWDLWRQQNLDTESNLAFIESLVTGRAFALVWAGDNGAEITFEHPEQAIVAYEPGSRTRRRYALKAWAEDGWDMATLYTVDEVWKFQRKGSGEWKPREVPNELWPLTHSLGSVPMVELANRPRLKGEPASELAPVVPMQDAVNLLWSHLMTASDYAAFPQRMILGAERPIEPIMDANGNVTGERAVPVERFRVSRIGWLEDPNAKLAEWSAADLSNYTKVIEQAVQHIAAQTKTPPDYLLGSMVNISGDALTAAERSLVSKVRERQQYFGGALREVMRLGHIANDNPLAAAQIAQGRVMWRDPQYRTESEHVDALMKMKALGVPDEAIWERLPDTDQVEIERWKAMQADGASRALGGDFSALLGPKAPTA